MECRSLDIVVASVVPERLSEIVVGMTLEFSCRKMVIGSRGTVSEGLVMIQWNGLRTAKRCSPRRQTWV